MARPAQQRTHMSARTWLKSHGPLPRDVRSRIDRDGLIYVHIPKAGGTSVSTWLHGRSLSHRTARVIKFWHPVRTRRANVFAVVREPVSRFLSAFDYLKSGGGNAGDLAFAQSSLAAFSHPGDLAHALEDPKLRSAVSSYFHFQPQSLYIARNGRFEVDGLARLNHLNADISEIVGRDVSLAHRNRTPGVRSLNADLDARALLALHTVYARDFAIWQVAQSARTGLRGVRAE